MATEAAAAIRRLRVRGYELGAMFMGIVSSFKGCASVGILGQEK
jgi:hypothetical protein